MNLIQENIESLKEARDAVTNHCLCFRLVECPVYFIAYLPSGYRFDGIRASKSVGKIAALKLIAEKLEHEWQTSFLN